MIWNGVYLLMYLFHINSIVLLTLNSIEMVEVWIIYSLFLSIVFYFFIHFVIHFFLRFIHFVISSFISFVILLREKKVKCWWTGGARRRTKKQKPVGKKDGKTTSHSNTIFGWTFVVKNTTVIEQMEKRREKLTGNKQTNHYGTGMDRWTWWLFLFLVLLIVQFILLNQIPMKEYRIRSIPFFFLLAFGCGACCIKKNDEERRRRRKEDEIRMC